MRKLIFILTAFLPLLSCSDSPADLSEYQGKNYIELNILDPTTEINWVRTDISGTYITFTAVVPSSTTGLPAGTTDYSRLEILNLITDGGFETGTGAWVNSGGGSIGVASDADSINPGNNSLEFINSSRVTYDLNTLSGAADNTEYVIHFSFNKNNIGIVNFGYDDNSTSYLSSSWTPSTGASFTSTDFPTSSGENNIIEIENIADNHYFSIGNIDLSTLQTGHIDDIKFVRNDIVLNLESTVPYTATGRPELISGNYRFSIYVMKEDSADINPTTVNRFPAETVTLYINNSPTAVDVTSVTDSEWVKISAEEFIQINGNDTIKLAVAPYNSTSPSLKEPGSILIAAPSLYYISD